MVLCVRESQVGEIAEEALRRIWRTVSTKTGSARPSCQSLLGILVREMSSLRFKRPRITLRTANNGKELLELRSPRNSQRHSSLGSCVSSTKHSQDSAKRNTSAIRAGVNQEAVAVSLSSLSRRSLYRVVRLILRISAALALLPPTCSTTSRT